MRTRSPGDCIREGVRGNEMMLTCAHTTTSGHRNIGVLINDVIILLLLGEHFHALDHKGAGLRIVLPKTGLEQGGFTDTTPELLGVGGC